MWAVIVKQIGASDISVSECSCLSELHEYVRRDPTIVGVRLHPRTGLGWYWNHPDWK